MRLRLLFLLICLSGAAAADCLPYDQLQNKKGDAVCVTGTVVKVGQSHAGNWFIDFCKDYRQCPFAVFIFERDANRLGDLRSLQGQQVTIYGRIRDYNGRNEIILRDKRQLQGEKLKYLPEEDEPRGMTADRDFDSSKHSRHHIPWHAGQHGSSKKPAAAGSSAPPAGSPTATPAGESTPDQGTQPGKPKS